MGGPPKGWPRIGFWGFGSRVLKFRGWKFRSLGLRSLGSKFWGGVGILGFYMLAGLKSV